MEPNMPSEKLIQAVAVTAELCGRTFSPEAAAVFVDDLSRHPEAQVLGALQRCRKEVRGVLTVQDVISRLDDGRPGADEAWSLIPQDEAKSVVWTAEMAQAFGVVLPLLDTGDKVGARLAFREAYNRLVANARDAGEPVNWSPSLGHDAKSREAALIEAVDRGHISLGRAQMYAPALQMHTSARDSRANVPQLPAPEQVQEVVQKIAQPVAPSDPLAWAYKLKAREESGDKRLTLFQRDAWRSALKGRMAA